MNDIIVLGRNFSIDELVPQFTEKNNLFENDVNTLIAECQASQDERNEYRNKLSNLFVHSQPIYPESYTGKVAAWSFGISTVAVILFFLFHCIIWVLKLIFDISWNTWEWTTTVFYIGLIGSSVLTLFCIIMHLRDKNKYYEELDAYNKYIDTKNYFESNICELSDKIGDLNTKLDEYQKARNCILGYLVRNKLFIPFNASNLTYDDFEHVKAGYFKLLKECNFVNNYSNEKDRQEKLLALFNNKLAFFYEHSIRLEIDDEDVYSEFKGKYENYIADNDANVLRGEFNRKGSKGYDGIENLHVYSDLLNDNRIEKHLARFNNIRNRDTSALVFFNSTAKLAEQTKDMRDMLTVVSDEYDELCNIIQSVQYLLGFVRGIAFRNIYLGSELINYLRAKTKGASLKSVHDTVKLTDVDMSEIFINDSVLISNSSGIISEELTRMSKVASLMDNKVGERFIMKNPKMTAAFLAVEVASSTIKVVTDHLEKVEHNKELQKTLVEEMSKLVDNYNSGQLQAMRAIEIVESVVKANYGFMKIYTPLFQDAFKNGDVSRISNENLIELAAAIKEYKKISETTIE